MKAIVWTKYGSPDVLQFAEVEKPVPADKEVLVKVFAATVTAGDCELRRFDISPLYWIFVRLMFGIRKPGMKILGQELAGEIESVGNDVTQFRKGDQVFAATGMRLGAYAEYACLPSTYPIAVIPRDMTFDEAATIPTGGLNALHFLRKSNTRKGQKVLINGAGGSIGTYAVQIAKLWGAHVTCVDRTDKLDMLISIGSDQVIDYTKEDFTTKGETYDIIIDVVGKSSFSRSVRSLGRNGRYVLGNPRLAGMIRGLWTSLTTGKKVISKLASYTTEDLNYLRDLIEEGRLKSVIDRRYPLEHVPEAHTYVEEGRKKGNVVITIGRHN
jgi:NADPH:quinone reductase-like Zn-dependent oxidoreductase